MLLESGCNGHMNGAGMSDTERANPERAAATFTCPTCGARVPFPESGAEAVICRSCGSRHVWRAESLDGGQLSACPLCGTKEMYVQKDFPHGVGLAVLAAGFTASTLFWLYYHYVHALLVLVGTALVDAVLYLLIGNATVCYRCRAVFRGVQANPEHGPWDIEVAERFRQERKRLEREDKDSPTVAPRQGTSA